LPEEIWTVSRMKALRCNKVTSKGSHDVVFGHVKASRRRFAHSGITLSITMLLAVLVMAATAPAFGQEPFARPEPNVQRQIDRLERQGTVDPATRRQLQDQLRRKPQGPERWAAERRLERLPDQAPVADDPLPEAPASTDSLPSSLRPGFGGGGGGPGTSGHMVPPGGRSGTIR
jgi:hypothetical protein